MARYHALRDLEPAALRHVSTFAADPAQLPDAPSTWKGEPNIVTRAIDFLERRQLLTPKEFTALRDQYKVAGFSIAGASNKGMLAAARTSLTDSVRRARTKDQAVASLERALAAGGYDPLRPWHADLVAQMAFSSAYGSASWQALQDPRVRGILPYLRYLTREDARVRPAHAVMDNFFAPRNDPIWRTWWPPNGFNCRCRVVGVTVQTVRDYGISKDAWPRLGGPRSARVLPDPGFRGNPGTFLAAKAGREQTARVREARRQAQERTRTRHARERRGEKVSSAPAPTLGALPNTPGATGPGTTPRRRR